MSQLTQVPRIPLDSTAEAPPENRGTTLVPPHTPSRWRKIGTVAALSAASLVTLGKLGQSFLANSWKTTWGTVENPRFNIASSASLPAISTFRDEAQSLREALLKERQEVRDFLGSTGLSDEERKEAAVALHTRLFGPPPSARQTQTPSEYTPRVMRASFTPKKSVAVYGRELAEQLLGAQLPDALSIKIGDVPFSGMGGFANIFTSNVTVEQTSIFPTERENYLEMVGTVVHEIGHQIFRHAEGRCLGWTPWQAANYDTSVREEAVAVLFRAIAGSQLSDPQERFLVSGNVHALAEGYFEGEKDYGLNEGAALADAALTLYPDSRQAFLMLSSPATLDPMLREIVDQNRELHREVQRLSAEREALREKLQQVIEAE